MGRGHRVAASTVPTVSTPVDLSEILRSRLWRYLQNFARYEFQSTMFQPVGGMDAIGVLHEKLVFGRRARVLAEELVKAIPDEGSTVLDVGCGN